MADCVPIPKDMLLAVIPADTAQAHNDILGKSVFELPDDTPLLEGVRQALRALDLIESGKRCGN